MKTIKRIGFLLVMAIVGAMLFYAYAVAADTGYLTKWELWEGVPENPVQVLAVDVVSTASGRTYQHLPFCIENCWQEVETPTIDSNPPLPIDACGWLPETSKYVQVVTTCTSYGPGGTATRVLAIDHKGNIYSWERFKGEGGIILITIAPYLGTVLGFVIGGIILALYWVVPHLKQKQEESPKKNAA